MARDPLEIIDDALKADDTDYGDKSPVGGDSDEGSDEGNDAGTVRTPPDQRGDGSPQPSPGDQPPAKQSGAPKPATQQANGKVQQAQPGQRQRVGSQFADGKGNIVDKDGKLIARAGAEARFWQEASRATAQITNLNRTVEGANAKIRELQQTHAQAQEIASIPQKLGISKEDFNEGMTIMSKWSTDPLWVAREVVARAMSLGHKVTDILGKEVGESVDTRAVAMMVNRATSPLEKQQQQTAAETERIKNAEKAMNSFLGSHDHADIHQEAIANLMEKGMGAERAYFEIKMFAMQHGLDFEQPLGPQVAQLRDGQRTTDQQPAPRPMANGNGRGNEQQLTDQPAQASASDSWGDILSRVMRQT